MESGGWPGQWPPPLEAENVDFWERPASWLAILLVKLYQKTLSGFWPNICIYSPSCSHYMIYAIRNKGLAAGIFLGGWRILRCHPFARGGYDPPPGYNEELTRRGRGSPPGTENGGDRQSGILVFNHAPDKDGSPQ